jgi:hypothetical protein
LKFDSQLDGNDSQLDEIRILAICFDDWKEGVSVKRTHSLSHCATKSAGFIRSWCLQDGLP